MHLQVQMGNQRSMLRQCSECVFIRHTYGIYTIEFSMAIAIENR